MTDRELFRVKITLVQAFLRSNGYDGILLSRVDNFAMATGGKRNYVPTSGDMGSSSLFVTRDGDAYFVGNNIEATRVMDEELGPLGCEARSFLWFEGSQAAAVKKEFGGVVVSDDGAIGENVNGKLAYLRSLLTPAELEKYRRLGRLASESMTAVLAGIDAGQTEGDVAARLISEGAARRCLVPVVLIAADERIAKYRHPLPTQRTLLEGGMAEKAIKDYVMVVGGFYKEGLTVSITRFKKVGSVSAEICAAYDRICGLDALLQEGSAPGKTLGEVFAECRQAYADLGFPENEWHNHHQGGTTGYAGRTCKGSPTETFPILDEVWGQRVSEILGGEVAFGQAFAWNPSGVGVKSEDTFILNPDGTKEIVSATPALPEVDLAGVLGRATEVVKSGMAG